MTLLTLSSIPTGQAKHGFENDKLSDDQSSSLSSFKQKTARLSFPRPFQLHARPTATLLLDPHTRSIVAWHIS